MTKKKFIPLFFGLGLILVTSIVWAVDGEWVICPRVDLPARVSPTLQNGKVNCIYWHERRSEILKETFVRSKSGQPFKSCLQSNLNYQEVEPQGGMGRWYGYTDRAFCSTTLTQDALNKTAYKWGRWAGENKKLKRVKMGHFSQRQGNISKFGSKQNFFPCRVKPKGYALGRVVNGKCEYYFNKSVRSTTQFEYLLLTADYGWPSWAAYNKESTIWLDPDFPFDSAVTPKVCTTEIHPEPFDMFGIDGRLPGVYTGAACVSHTAGKPFIDKSNMPGRLAGFY